VGSASVKALLSRWLILGRVEGATFCEQYRAGFLGQPASAVTSVAFVLAGAGILVARSRSAAGISGRDRQVVYSVLVAGIGLGSFIQHGPHPDWQAYAHDLPLAAVLVFVATDAICDLAGRELSDMWWLVPSAAMVPVVAWGSTASIVAQAAMAAAAIGVNLVRIRWRPQLRKPVITALVTAAAGVVISWLMDRTWLGGPNSVMQGHAVWHVLAAAALWRLAPAIGARRRPAVVASIGPARSARR
jgi:hypothetical protein